MNAALWRSAYSAVIYEGHDSAVAPINAEGNMLGRSTGVPLLVGANDACVRHVLDYYGDDIAADDIFIMNDSGERIFTISRPLVRFSSKASWKDSALPEFTGTT